MILNKLHINQSKCYYIHFKPKTKNNSENIRDFKLFINSQEIKKVAETKFLGVFIDQDLNWDKHILECKRKLNYAIAT